MSQTYYNHTSKLEPTKLKFVPASSLALKREGDMFHYGVSICSHLDNFSRKTGRQMAEARMNDGFGSLPVPDVIKHLPEKESCLFMLYNLTASVVVRNKKWKREITRFTATGQRKEGEKLESKIIQMTSSPEAYENYSKSSQKQPA